MKTTVFLLLFCILTANCATYKTQDEKLNRIIRSPHLTKSDSGDSSIVFRTQNWSGVAHGADGAQGVFSGASAAAGSAAPAADEAFSIAASGAAPVKDKLEERFGGSDYSDLHYIKFKPAPPNFYNPYIPNHHGNGHWGHVYDYHRGFSGHQRGGYNYGQFNSGTNSQAFARSEASSNAASGCDDQPNTDSLSKSQAYSNAVGGFGDKTYKNSGIFSSNSYRKSQTMSFPLISDQNNGGYGSGLYNNQNQQHTILNGASNGNLQSTAESKTFAQSKSFNSGVKQAKSFGNGLTNFQGLDNTGGQQVESHGNEFSSSQGLQDGGGLQVESHGNGFGSSKGFQNGGGLQVESHSNGFGSSQGLQNSGGQQVESFGNGFGSSQGFQNSEEHKDKYEDNSNGFANDQSQKKSYGFDNNSNNGYGSQLSKGFELGTGSTNGNAQSNNNRQDISSVSGSRTFDGGFTGHGQKYAYGGGFGNTKYQADTDSKDLQADRISGQSSKSDGSLTNNGNSNGQQSLSSSSGASGHEDLQSTLSGALGLASQGLQASQNQPCSTCQKSSYAFSNAKSKSGSAVALSIGG